MIVLYYYCSIVALLDNVLVPGGVLVFRGESRVESLKDSEGEGQTNSCLDRLGFDRQNKMVYDRKGFKTFGDSASYFRQLY